MMKIVFSESNPDYKNYTFPYVVFGIPEGISEIAELYSMGFLPSKKPYYYLARSTRISLNRFKVTQRLRKLLNARKDIEMQLVDASNFVLDALAKSMCLQCAASRFGKGVVDECRLDRIIAPIKTTHIMQFRWRWKMIGLVAMNIVDAVAHYNFAFYDLTLAKMSPGIYMLATAAVFFKEHGYTHLYMGTCYSTPFLYKSRFEGFEFFNGAGWSKNMEELNFLITRVATPGHLFECDEYMENFSPMGMNINAISDACGHALRTAVNKPDSDQYEST